MVLFGLLRDGQHLGILVARQHWRRGRFGRGLLVGARAEHAQHDQADHADHQDLEQPDDLVGREIGIPAGLGVGGFGRGGKGQAFDHHAVAAFGVDADGILDQAGQLLLARLGQAGGAAIDRNRDRQAGQLARLAGDDTAGRAVSVGRVFGVFLARLLPGLAAIRADRLLLLTDGTSSGVPVLQEYRQGRRPDGGGTRMQRLLLRRVRVRVCGAHVRM